jgi:hypothetical protein
VNTRHEVFRLLQASHGIIALRPVLMYYAIEIDSSLFLLGWLSQGCPWDVQDVLDVDLSSLFIVGESPHKI